MLSPFPLRALPTDSLIEKKLFFLRAKWSVWNEREKRFHRRPPKTATLSSSRFLSHSLQPLFLELKIFLAGRRLVKSSWQQSIQSLPSSVVSNVPSALLTLEERVFLLHDATLFSWSSQTAFERSLLCSRISCQSERQEMSLLCRIN